MSFCLHNKVALVLALAPSYDHEFVNWFNNGSWVRFQAAKILLIFAKNAWRIREL